MEADPPLSSSLGILQLSAYFLVQPGLLGGIGVLLLLLILCSALVSGSEIAYFSLSPDEANLLRGDNKASSKRIIQLRQKPRTLLATILISNNFVNITIVILSDFLLWNLFGDDTFRLWGQSLKANMSWIPLTDTGLTRLINFVITIFGVTFLLVLFGEVAPKIYAKFNNLTLARFMSRPLLLLRRLFWPFSSMLVSWSNKIENRLSTKSGSENHKEEIDQAIELTVRRDLGSDKEVDILKRIIKFSEVTTKQIMRSRVDVVAVELQTPYNELMETIRKSGFSRIPVFEEDFDHMRGILYAKDLIGHLDEAENFRWQNLIRTDLLYVPESKRINELLKEFQEKRLHMTIVVDEYGGSSGIVTLEDVMEEVIGEIRDEFDRDEEVDYIQIDDKNYVFEGKTMLNDVCRLIGVDTRTFDPLKGESDSIAGLMLELLGEIPRAGQELKLKNYKLSVVSVSKRRIEKVKLTILS